MDPTELARWQFASLTVYHYMIVPLSIGLTLAVALMQTLGHRRLGTATGQTWDRASRFYGRIMLALFALGIVTGLVQEFQFGMNWSAYSRFVGDIFGAPLAMEGLVAFSARACTWPPSGWPRSARSRAPTSSWPPTASCSTPSGWSTTPSATGSS